MNSADPAVTTTADRTSRLAPGTVTHPKRTAGRAMLGAALLAVGGSVAAQLPDPYQGRSEWDPTDAEVAQLPPYCQADMRPQIFRGPGTKAYGCGVWINHFCPGLAALNRAMNPLLPMKARQGNLRAAEDHLQYTRKHLTPTCRLAPDLQAAEQQAKMLRMIVK